MHRDSRLEGEIERARTLRHGANREDVAAIKRRLLSAVNVLSHEHALGNADLDLFLLIPLQRHTQRERESNLEESAFAVSRKGITGWAI